MGWTSGQQDAIETRNCNILVSAAAGSGKTAVLVERIKQLILTDQVPLDRMLIVTFSNAAASEMKEKILHAITKAIEEEPSSSFLRAQPGLINKANISTFHAFSMEVLRRYFHLIDLEPNFRICDEAQKAILQQEAMDKLFEEQFRMRDSAFLQFLKKYASSKNEDQAKQTILTVHRFIQSLPDPFSWLSQKVSMLETTEEEFTNSALYLELFDRIKWLLQRQYLCFKQVEQILQTAGIPVMHRKSLSDLEQIQELIHIFETEDLDQFGLRSRQVSFSVFRAGKEEQQAWEQVRDQVTVLRDKAKDLYKRMNKNYTGRTVAECVQEARSTLGDGTLLYNLVQAFDEIYSLKKQEKGVLDFSDLEHLALGVLRHEEAAKEYREKFQYIFIDEYQDSNLVQETLIDSIKRSDNVFMVGDVKQSIYKFRLAEPELFLAKYDTFLKEADAGENGTQPRNKKIDLNENFRSKGRIIDGINDLFAMIMNKQIAGMEYDQDAALHKGLYQKDDLGQPIISVYPTELEYPVELHLVDGRQDETREIDEEIMEMRRVELEASVAAQIIRDAIGKSIYDQKNSQIRPIALKDIVILLRSTKNDAEIYADQLRQLGFPAYIDSSDGYFDTVEIGVFLNLLRVIDNKKQDVPLLSILRAPIFNFSVDELILIRSSHQHGPFYQAFLAFSTGVDDLAQKCHSVLNRLDLFRLSATVMPLDEFLWLLLRETGYYDYSGAMPAGAQRQANLRALVEKAMLFQQSHLKGLFGFILYIEAVKNNRVSTGQIKLLGESDNVIRIMTVHKSKGLEFPIVIVGGLGKKFNQDSNALPISLHKSLGVALRLVDLNQRSYRKTIQQLIIEEKNGSERLAEEMRILYVALTRAMDRLILLGGHADLDKLMEKYRFHNEQDLPDGKNYLDWILPALPHTDIKMKLYDRSGIRRSQQIVGQAGDSLKDALKNGFALEQSEEENSSSDDLLGRLEQSLLWQYPFQYQQSVKSKYSVTEINERIRGSRQKKEYQSVALIPRFLNRTEPMNAAQRGTILHRIMEHLDFLETNEILKLGGPQEALSYIQKRIHTLMDQGVLSEVEAESASPSMLLDFFRSKLGERASRAEELRKEISFNMKVSLKELEWNGAERESMIGLEEDTDQVIVQGTIDCSFMDAGKLVMVDYKSSYVGANQEKRIEELMQQYQGQIRLYQRALEKYYGRKVDEAYLYLFGIGREVRMKLD